MEESQGPCGAERDESMLGIYYIEVTNRARMPTSSGKLASAYLRVRKGEYTSSRVPNYPSFSCFSTWNITYLNGLFHDHPRNEAAAWVTRCINSRQYANKGHKQPAFQILKRRDYRTYMDNELQDSNDALTNECQTHKPQSSNLLLLFPRVFHVCPIHN